MKKVLFLTYYFPPIAGGGVQRSSKFVKYLPNFGWEPIVITVNDDPSQPKDETLLKDVGKARIIRTKCNIIPHKLLQNRYVREALDLILCPDINIGWLPYIREKVDEIIENEDISLVYTSCRPFSLNLEGMRIKKKYGIPWVTDFRDPWTLNTFFKPVTPVHGWINRKIEKRAMELCDYYIANTESNLTRAYEVFPVLNTKSTWIPNGFDPEDFKSDKDGAYNKKSNGMDSWNITYTGACYHTYNPKDLLKIIREFIDDNKECGREIVINYAGSHFKCFLRYASKYNLESYVINHGYLSHADSVELIKNSDLLLLYLPDDDKASSWVPGKLYEYLASNIPIFAIVPQGDTFDIINKSGAGIALTHEEIESIGYKELENQYSKWRSCVNHAEINVKYITKYNRYVQTQKLANIFDKLTHRKL